MTKKIPAELRFDEITGQYILREGKSEELCKNGEPHKFTINAVCDICGITKFELEMRYGHDSTM